MSAPGRSPTFANDRSSYSRFAARRFQPGEHAGRAGTAPDKRGGPHLRKVCRTRSAKTSRVIRQVVKMIRDMATISEIAEALSVSPNAVREWIRVQPELAAAVQECSTRTIRAGEDGALRASPRWRRARDDELPRACLSGRGPTAVTCQRQK